jgi:glycosyltransferase involved in cell wall biosynthesis
MIKFNPHRAWQPLCKARMPFRMTTTNGNVTVDLDASMVTGTSNLGQSESRPASKLRIGFVVHPFWGLPDTTSTHIAVHEVACRLPDTCSSIVYTGRLGEPGPVDYRNGVQYRRIKIPSENRYVRLLGKVPILRRLKGSLSFRSSWYYWGHAVQIALDARAQGCDIIQIQNLSQFAPIIRALNPKAKIVLNMHCEWLTRLNPSSIRRRLRSVDLVLSCSDFVTNQIREAFPEVANRCATLYNGVDIAHFFPNRQPKEVSRAKRLLYVGAVAPHKGLHVLLDSLPEVLKQHPELQLEIVGNPSYPLPWGWLSTLGDPTEMARLARFYDGKGYVSHLKDQIDRLNLTNFVVFSGEVSRADLAERFRLADVFVFPSLWNELFGIPTAEAMASGVPVVTSRIAGLPEVVEDRRTGFLVPPGDPSELARAISRLLGDDNLRRSMGQAGRQRILQHFTWERIAQDLLQRYASLAIPTGGDSDGRR